MNQLSAVSNDRAVPGGLRWWHAVVAILFFLAVDIQLYRFAQNTVRPLSREARGSQTQIDDLNYRLSVATAALEAQGDREKLIAETLRSLSKDIEALKSATSNVDKQLSTLDSAIQALTRRVSRIERPTAR